MNRIQTALYNRQIKKLTRKYQAQAAFNATEQSRAGLAAVENAIAALESER